MFHVLRNRNYTFLWVGSLISATGDWVLRAALPFYVFVQTGSALATGLAFLSGIVPWILLSSFAGVFVDRWDRKRTMIISDILRAIVILSLLLILYIPTLFWLIYLVSFLEACVSQFFNPASFALLPLLVEKKQLQEANSLRFLANSLSRVIGPILGGALLGLFGFTSTILVDSISYACSAMLIALAVLPRDLAKKVDDEPLSEATPRSKTYWHDWFECFQAVKQNPLLVSLFVSTALAFLADGSLSPLLVVFASSVLHLGSLQYGWMLTALGIGTIAGSLLCGVLTKFTPVTRFFASCLLAEGVIYLSAFHIGLLFGILALFLLVGTPAMGWQISTQTLLQSSSEDRLQGRIFSIYVMLQAFALLLGTSIGSALVMYLGVVSVLTGGCVFFILAGGVALILLPTRIAQLPKPPVVSLTEENAAAEQ